MGFGRILSIINAVASVAWVSAAMPAVARPLYSPQSPSVEINLEALRDLKQQSLSASPFGAVAAPPSGYVPPMAASSPAASGRQVPLMNRPYVTMPQITNAPSSAMPQAGATRMSLEQYQAQRGRTPQGYKIVATRSDGYGTRVPVAMPDARYHQAESTSRPMPPVIHDDTPLLPKRAKPSVRTNLPAIEKLKSADPKEDQAATPPPVPKMPDVAKLKDPEAIDGTKTPLAKTSSNLPEPNMADMDFEDFPELKPLPDSDAPKLPPVAMPEVAMPQVPRLPNKPAPEPDKEAIKAPNPDELMPSLSKGIDTFITKNQGQPSPSGGKAISRLPQTPDVALPTPVEMPSIDKLTDNAMPKMPDMPKDMPALPEPIDAPQKMASLPDMPVDFPTLEAPPIETPAAPVASGSALLSLTFAATENEVPVSGQKQLAALATKLIASNQAVEIEPYVKGASDQDMVANRIATSRAFSVRTFLIDKGVKAENLVIGKRRINSDKNAIEKVDIVGK